MLDLEIMVEINGIKRIIEPSDICILLRSRGRSQHYIKELDHVGVRCWSDMQGGFLDSNEIAPLVSYLKIIANPLLDLEMSQVLCSYLYGFDSDKLATLRQDKTRSLYSVLIEAQETDPLCKSFLDDLQLLRTHCVTRDTTQVIGMLYALTGAQHKALVMSQGENRRNNLRLLVDYAHNYNQGLDFGGFVSYLYAMAEYDCDMTPATSAPGNAVSIMSIHKSKGLEFPVVFLCDTASRFNIMDLASDVLMHPELGFACVLRDNRTMTQHRTIPLSAMAIENKRGMFSEELRVLYVALTRAKERLIITGADKGLARMNKMADAPIMNGQVSPWTVRTAISYYDWIVASLCHHPDFPQEILAKPSAVIPATIDVGQLTVEVVSVVTEETEESSIEESDQIDNDIVLAKMMGNIQWQYPHEADTLTPIKISVSQLAKAEDAKKYLFHNKPIFMGKSAYTSTEKGIATHKFIQFADYEKAAISVMEEKQRLLDEHYLSPREGDGISMNHVERFFKSPLFQRIIKADACYREIRFMQEITPQEIVELGLSIELAGNTVVQGIADCVIVEGEEVTVIDYKTDQATSKEQLTGRYAQQLTLYSFILEKVLGKKITAKIIYSFPLGEEIVVV